MDRIIPVVVLPFNDAGASAIDMSIEFDIVMVSADVIVVFEMISFVLWAAASAHALKFVAIPPLASATTAGRFVIVAELSGRRAVRGHGLQ